MPPPKTTLAFDAYGTLLSTSSIASALAAHFGESQARALAATWRKYQLEYTWRLTSMNAYQSFDLVTQAALMHTIAEAGLPSMKKEEVEALMRKYDELDIFPDVQSCLEAVRKRGDIHAVVFSNGTQSMVSSSVTGNSGLRQFSDVLEKIIVVEEVRKFKPAPEVYRHLVQKVGKDPDKDEDVASVWLVSGNPFDVVGARAFGMKAIWVDREGKGWVDRLVSGEMGEPTAIVSSLEMVVEEVKRAGA